MSTYKVFICLCILVSAGITAYDFRHHHPVYGIAQAIGTCCVPLAPWAAARMAKNRNRK